MIGLFEFLNTNVVAAVAFLGAVATSVTGVLIWAATRNAASRRAALDILKDHIGDKDWIQADKEFNGLLEKGKLEFDRKPKTSGRFNKQKYLQDFADDSRVFTEERRTILKILNRYEMIAAAIRHKAINERIYKSFWGGPVLAKFDELILFIAERQKVNGKAYRELHWLAFRWSDPSQRKRIMRQIGHPESMNAGIISALAGLSSLMKYKIPIGAVLLVIATVLVTLALS
ncbi:MAG: DUF4760 domain-containing protein [Pseudomonadota bacterium]